ncbi:MAG: tripartite tricarboxylate transporter TctB family protein [Dictyoglomus sp.]|nr:tripartite tricarboxylate transporter TctB family protein [Dictyoglomus sp.]MDW8189108.1 tripartite tricarboxylate transporter TctB family protein [Dictyoglomus sp.]
MKFKINWDVGIGIGIVILGIFILILTLGMPKSPLGLGPGDYPRVISYGLIITGIILIIQGLKEEPSSQRIYSLNSLKRVGLLVLLGLLYVYLVHYIGFLYLTPFLMVATMYLFGYKKLLWGIIISILFTLLVNFIFYNIFKVPLPVFSLF